MNIISFSLWGNDPKYTHGAVRNAQLASTWYRGWKCRFYCDSATTPVETMEQIRSIPNTELVLMDSTKDPHWGGFWRFYAINDMSTSHVIFRDTDSRPSHREAMAVQEWISSGKGFHIMRDHTGHGVPVCAGMWGAKTTTEFDMLDMINRYYSEGIDTTKVYGGIDQDFLVKFLWDRIKGDMVEHDEFFAKKPFPLPRDPKHFVGQVYDKNDRPQF